MTECLPTLAAPPFDDALEDFRFTAGFAPQLRKKRIARRRPLLFLERVKVDADRDRDAFAADDAFAVAQRRDRIDEAACAFVHRRFHELLVALVVEAHRDDRSEMDTSELQSLMRVSYAVFCLKKKK